MLKVLSNKFGSSPYSRKGLIVLEEKGLPYEQINTDPEFLPEGFKENMNPNLRVSILSMATKKSLSRTILLTIFCALTLTLSLPQRRYLLLRNRRLARIIT